MQRTIQRAAFLARLRDPILLAGPTGTGKSTLARWIHEHSDRAHRPFVGVNCGALPGSLFASEVFGHVRGAFTGATHDATGLARAADGGTLFLDEIAEIRLEDQRKLLTFLDTECVRPVGSTTRHRVNVRIVAATNGDLTDPQRFRQDLRYRLEALRITLPSLVQRPEDLPSLVRHLVHDVAERNGMAPLGVTLDALGVLASRDWPGNVRQLRNVLLNAWALAHAEGCRRIDVRHLDTPRPQVSWKALAQGYQQAVVAEALREAQGNRKQAAARLEMSESRLYDVLRRERSG